MTSNHQPILTIYAGIRLAFALAHYDLKADGDRAAREKRLLRFLGVTKDVEEFRREMHQEHEGAEIAEDSMGEISGSQHCEQEDNGRYIMRSGRT